MMRVSWHKSAINHSKNGCKKAENNVIKIISDRTSNSKVAISMQMSFFLGDDETKKSKGTSATDSFHFSLLYLGFIFQFRF